MKKYIRLSLILTITIALSGCSLQPQPTLIVANAQEQSLAVTLSTNSIKVIADIATAEQLIAKMLNTKDAKIINNAAMAFIRKDRYGYASKGINASVWNQFAGGLLNECGIDISQAAVLEQYKDVITLCENFGPFTEPVEDFDLDFIHMIAVIDIEYTDTAEHAYQETYYDALFTWGGDLETFLIDMSDFDTSIDSMYTFAKGLLGTDQPSHFSKEDLLADIDGRNIAILMKSNNILLSEALKQYYTSGSANTRYTTFVTSYGGKEAFTELVNGFMTGSVEKQYKGDVEFLDFITKFKGMKKFMLKSVDEYSGSYSDSMRGVASQVFIAIVLDGK